jgi:hypothetical protein
MIRSIHMARLQEKIIDEFLQTQNKIRTIPKDNRFRPRKFMKKGDHMITPEIYEQLPPKEKWRVRNNKHYLPGDFWEVNCHPSYAHLSENSRTKQFVKEMECLMKPLPEFGYGSKEIAIFKRARAKADKLRIKYKDYVSALCLAFGDKKMSYTRLNYKEYESCVKTWKRKGSVYPASKVYDKLVLRNQIARKRREE